MADSIRILHVDDEPDLGELTATLLEREDDRFDVESEAAVEAAVERLGSAAEPAFDCVVSDYDMPGMNGIEFLEVVRESHPELPFILFTGKGSEEIASEAISAGVTDYLQKKPGSEQYQLLANRIGNYVERARARSERQRHLNAIETAREGIGILDDTERFVYVNDAYADLYGYDPEELLGEHWRILYRDEDVPKIRDEVLPNVDAKGFWRGETVGLRADGSTFVEDHSLSRTAEGGLVCTVRDITERKERERQLREKTVRLEALFERSPDMINIHDASGTILDVNQRFCEALDAAPEEIVGRNICDVDENVEAEELSEILSGIEVDDRLAVETEFRRTDGSTFPAEVHVRRLNIRDRDRFVVITRDITERKQYERKHRTERRFVESMLDSILDLFYAVDTEGRLLRWNERVAELTGYSEERLDGIPVKELLADEEADEIAAHIRTVIEERRPLRTEATVRTRDGERIYELSGCPFEDPEGGLLGVVGIGRDITAQKRQEIQLKRQNERLDAFASTITHDLRNPLSTAQGYLELAREDGDPAHFEQIEHSLDRMDRIVGDVLWLAREGKEIGSMEVVDLGESVEAAWAVVGGDDSPTTLEVDRSLDGVEADPDRLRQLLENVLANAIEHGGDAVWVEPVPGGFAIGDNGPGIPATDSERVFDRGYSTAEDGTGIGLAIVREIAEAHGWESTVEQRDGGTRFEFTHVDRRG
ncbi:PAS domain S-box protein [Halobellus sp. GM3]|uniref:PAS domain S-box protein n=1 Tax=Halobellus sp. GM3 TaxID=3458410 RepID=UPI00403D571F